MDKKGIGTSIILAVILAIITLGLTGYIIYDKKNDIKKEKEWTKKRDEAVQKTIDSMKTGAIPTSDLISFQVEPNVLNLLKIEKNILYGAHVSSQNIDSSSLKFTAIYSNVKRIKPFHTSSNLLITYYIILNNGYVMQIEEPVNNTERFKITKCSYLKDYKVDDILSVTGTFDGNSKPVFELKLLDGTIKKV